MFTRILDRERETGGKKIYSQIDRSTNLQIPTC